MHTVDAKEIENFAKDSSCWWDEGGPFAQLHRIGHLRLAYIRERICGHFGRDQNGFTPYEGLSVIDIGCGGGLVCEPMARLGAAVTGLDADANAIGVAITHADESGLDIAYHAKATGDFLAMKSGAGNQKPHEGAFDVVLALEIVEHVSDVQTFVNDCMALCKPGGIVIFSTLNRTIKSLAFGKIAAEYILRWVPAGTHDWKKFVRPSELAGAVRHAGGRVLNTEGMVFDPLARDFKRSARGLDVNYFLTAGK
ncbi:MAG: bifunctional 2-polyprenyl-6-hydroxyphenol methylase/3-demethylubiquinol 3-O-methyltransferase UbiG [Micavibrio sp.]